MLMRPNDRGRDTGRSRRDPERWTSLAASRWLRHRPASRGSLHSEMVIAILAVSGREPLGSGPLRGDRPARAWRESLMDLQIKRFDQADESRSFEKGEFQLVTAGGMTPGRASYEPGWKWSPHVGPTVGTEHR